MSDVLNAIRIGARISELVGLVFDPVATVLGEEEWNPRFQSILWQALAREAMLRAQQATRAERDSRSKRKGGAPDDA